VGSGAPAFVLKSAFGGPGARWRSLALGARFAFRGVARGLPSHFSGTSAWGRKFDARTARFGQANRDRLFRRTRAMLAFANVMHFLTHEFASLRGSRFSLAPIFFSPPECFLFWDIVSPFLLTSMSSEFQLATLSSQKNSDQPYDCRYCGRRFAHRVSKKRSRTMVAIVPLRGPISAVI
jgi:hypothetical protein